MKLPNDPSLSVCSLVGWSVGLSVGLSLFPKKRQRSYTFNAPIGALVTAMNEEEGKEMVFRRPVITCIHMKEYASDQSRI